MWQTECMVQWSEIQLVDDLVVRVVTNNLGLCAIHFRLSEPVQGERNDANPLARETAAQLEAYFDGRLRRFDLALDLQGTAFQKRVWHELERIPYGETRSYM